VIQPATVKYHLGVMQEHFQVLQSCSVCETLSMEKHLKDTDLGDNRIHEKNLSHCQFIHHKFH